MYPGWNAGNLRGSNVVVARVQKAIMVLNSTIPDALVRPLRQLAVCNQDQCFFRSVPSFINRRPSGSDSSDLKYTKDNHKIACSSGVYLGQLTQ